MNQINLLKKLSKFLSYILGHCPNEFGLVLDQDGYVKIKELLKAVHEEDGWKYVRRKHIEEILVSLTNPSIEINDNYIRMKNRENLPKHLPAQNLPKLLYTCVRRKAYSVVVGKRIFPLDHRQVVLSSDKDMAERIGKRRDLQPVTLTVHVQKSVDKGIVFYQAGKLLYLSESIPADCFIGPPLPKEKPEKTKKEKTEELKQNKIHGSFILELENNKGRKKDISWKKSKKRMRKQKQKVWPD